MIKKIFFSSFVAAASMLAANAHTVLLEERFADNPDGGFYEMNYAKNFPVILELDHLPPAANVNSVFMDSNGKSRPWVRVKDVSTSSDGFIVSHSQYRGGGTSNDWLGSVPVTIPTEGFNLTFDAQSGTVFSNSDALLSDLWLFITEEPLDENNLPTEPTEVYREISAGVTPTQFEGEFTNFTVNLDPYVGKTIYINFANLNTDKQLLALDNILIQRLDPIGVEVTAPQYAVDGEGFDVNAIITNTSSEEIKDLKVSFSSNGVDSDSSEIPSLAAGESKEFTFTGYADADGVSSCTVTVSGNDMNNIISSAEVKGVSYRPKRRVLFEEATGVWCGNCPLGMYNIECMMTDDEMKEILVPVSIHINNSAIPGVLVNEDYAAMIGLNSAPTFRLDRGKTALNFSLANDMKYDKTNPKSVAYAIKAKSESMALFDINVSGELVETDGRKKIRAKAEVIPVRSTNEDTRYAVGFILTENNVSQPGSPDLVQSNYVSGQAIDGNLGGFCLLPDHISNMRFQDVAREIYGFNGIEDSLPAVMTMNETYTVESELPLPDTYKESNGKCVAPAIKPENLTLIAFIITTDSHDVANSVAFPMSEQTENRFLINDVYKEWVAGVDEIGYDYDGEAEYYTLDGFRIDNPSQPGIYVVRRGAKVSKEIIR